jgi:hypothetical protein
MPVDSSEPHVDVFFWHQSTRNHHVAYFELANGDDPRKSGLCIECVRSPRRRRGPDAPPPWGIIVFGEMVSGEFEDLGIAMYTAEVEAIKRIRQAARVLGWAPR